MPDKNEVFHQIVRAVSNVPDGKLEEAIAKVREILEQADEEPEDEEDEEPAPTRKASTTTTKNRLQRGGRNRSR